MKLSPVFIWYAGVALATIGMMVWFILSQGLRVSLTVGAILLLSLFIGWMVDEWRRP